MIAELFARAAAMLYTPEDAAAWRANWTLSGLETSAGEYVNETNALRVPPVKAAVSVLAETLATLPVEIFRQTGNGKRTLAPEHPVSNLMTYAPNDEMSAYTWKHTLQMHLGTWGNAYSWIRRDGTGNIIELVPLDPQPERTAPKRNPVDGKIWYRIRNEKGEEENPLPAKDVLHIRYFSLDGLTGQSPVHLVREAIAGNKAAERFANEVFKNAAAADGVYKTAGKLSEGAYKRLKASLADAAEHGNRHRRMILEEGLEFQQTSMRPGEVQMIEVRRFLLEEIARAYRISPTLLQDLTHGTYSNITELGRQFIVYTMLPWLKLWESEINRKLLEPPFHCYINPAEFLRGDHVARSVMHRTLFGIGAKSVNEIRDDEDLNPLDDPNADEHFVPLNMVPLSKATDPNWGKPKQEGGNPNDSKKPGGVPPGDGQEPVEEPPKESVPREALTAAQRAVYAIDDRMARIERNAALRAARDPADFTSTVDSFYQRHSVTVMDAMRPAVRVVAACGGKFAGDLCADEWLVATVTETLDRHKALLLEAAECQPAELLGRVTATVETWNQPGREPQGV